MVTPPRILFRIRLIRHCCVRTWIFDCLSSILLVLWRVLVFRTEKLSSKKTKKMQSGNLTSWIQINCLVCFCCNWFFVVSSRSQLFFLFFALFFLFFVSCFSCWIFTCESATHTPIITNRQVANKGATETDRMHRLADLLLTALCIIQIVIKLIKKNAMFWTVIVQRIVLF